MFFKRVSIFLCVLIVSCVELDQTQLEFSEDSLDNDGVIDQSFNNLYLNHCSSCHGDLNTSTKLGRSSTQIKNAINNISSMSSLSFLSDVQIESIERELSFEIPELNNFIPVGELASSLTTVDIGVISNEDSTCRFSSIYQNYNQMSESFDSSDGLNHTKSVPVSQGNSYLFYVRCADKFQNISNVGQITFSIADASTPDITAPSLSQFSPSNNTTLASGTSSVNVSFVTNENANCKQSQISTATYSQMANMTSSGGTVHQYNLGGLNDGSSYSLYFICRDESNNESSRSSITFSIAVALSGQELYANHCSSCHQDLSHSDKLGRSSIQIQNAINGISAMQSLSFLSSSQVNLIEEALSYVPPQMSSLLPSGELPSSTTSALLRVQTNERATCKYSSSDQSYSSMPGTFNSTSDGLGHSRSVAVSEGMSYQYYIKCSDAFNNENVISANINFSIASSSVPDTTAPTLDQFNIGDNHVFDYGTTSEAITFTTNEHANCKSSTNASHTYNQMQTITTTGQANQQLLISGLANGQSYTYYFLCQDEAGNTSNKESRSFSIEATQSLDGEALYATNCAACHNPLENSTKKFRTLSQIQTAIQNVPIMNNTELNALNVDELTAIESALAQTNTSVDSEKLDVRLRVGGRRYTEGVIRRAFKVNHMQISAVQNKIFQNITFGGGCDFYAAFNSQSLGSEYPMERCFGSAMTSVMKPIYSIARSADTIHVCEKLVGYNDVMTNALGNMNVAWSESKFVEIYQRYFPFLTPSAELISRFSTLFSEQSNNTDGWRIIMLTMCISPDWQIF